MALGGERHGDGARRVDVPLRLRGEDGVVCAGLDRERRTPVPEWGIEPHIIVVVARLVRGQCLLPQLGQDSHSAAQNFGLSRSARNDVEVRAARHLAVCERTAQARLSHAQSAPLLAHDECIRRHQLGSGNYKVRFTGNPLWRIHRSVPQSRLDATRAGTP